MDTNMMRGSAEAVSGLAEDCARLVNSLLAVVDANAQTGQRTPLQEILATAAARLEVMLHELDSLKRQLITLRLSEATKRALPPEVSDVDDSALRLNMDLDGVVSRSFLFARAANLLCAPPGEKAEFRRNLRIHVELMERIAELCHTVDQYNEESWDRRFITTALSRIRSLHDGIPFEQAEELTTRRWRD